MNYELSDREIRLLHNALSEYRERAGGRGLSHVSEKSEELRQRLVHESPLEHEGYRLKVPV